MDLVVWNILLTWPWALCWLPICFWVQLLDLILILKVGDGLRPTLTGFWLNLMGAELPSLGRVFIQFSQTQSHWAFEQYKNYVLLGGGLRVKKTIPTKAICPTYWFFFFFFPSDHSTHSLVLGSCVLKFSLAWLREVTWVDIKKWCWGLGYLFFWIPFWAFFGLGESLHYGFLPGSLHWSPFLPVFGSTLQPYPLLPSNNSKVFNCS